MSQPRAITKGGSGMNATEIKRRWAAVKDGPELEKLKADLVRPLIERTLEILARKGKIKGKTSLKKDIR